MSWSHDNAKRSAYIILDIELLEGSIGYPIEVIDLFSMYQLILLTDLN